jgi:hypothetical protein|nr:MAG TPA: hypothetical protein [Crassvirales sp.]
MKPITDTNYILLTKDEYKTLIDNAANITVKYEYGRHMHFEGNIGLSKETNDSICLDLYDKFKRIDRYYEEKTRNYNRMLEANAYEWKVQTAESIKVKLLSSRVLRLFKNKIINIIDKYILNL